MIRMSADAVVERLQTMSTLSASQPSPMPRGVDMSPTAVAARLRDMADVSELCSRLAAIGARISRR